LRTGPNQKLYEAYSEALNWTQPTVAVKGPTPEASPGSESDKRENRDIVRPGDIAKNKRRHPGPLVDDPGVLFTDTADLEERDTASHLEQAQKLLVSFRSLQTDDDQDVDVSYEKTESRRLLNENVVLRRDAEIAGKFPTKSVLGSLEPFLIDIANLPDKAAARDVQQIKDRVQRTEIVAELRGY
jgi:hypothetical protein